jgi:hypothetical protein
MTIVNFLSGSPGPTGPTGPVSEQYQNSLAMIAWLTGEGIVKGFNFESYNFVTKDGIDPSSIVEYNASGYCEAPVADTSKQLILSFDDEAKILKKNFQGIIYRWYQDNSALGHFEGTTKVLSASAATDKGSGKVGLPCGNHGYATGTSISVRGTVNYNAIFSVDATSSTNEIVVTASYVSETFTGNETVNQRVTLGSGKENADIEKGVLVRFLTGDKYVYNITSYGDGASGVQLDSEKSTEPVVGIYKVSVLDGMLSSSRYKADDFTWTTLGTDAPPPRENSALIWDSTNSVFWMYGGYCYSNIFRSDLWKYNPATSQWTKLSPTGGPPNARYCFSMICDPVNNSLLVFGGLNASSANLNELWKYDIATNAWSQLSPSGGPPTIRYDHTAVYDSVNAAMLVYGGRDGSTSKNELWKYTIATNTWAQVTFSGSITARREHVAIYEASQQLMWVWGGYTTTSVGELWKYDVVANSFTQITQTSPPSNRYGHTAAYDPTNRYMYLFGGYSTLSDLYRYNLATNTWTTLTPSSAWNPDGRHYSQMSFCPSSGYVYLFGGYTTPGLIAGTAARSDFWSYNPSANTWALVAPPPRSLATCVFAPNRNSVVCGYGMVDEVSDTPAIKDAWEFLLSTSQWSRPYTSTTVAPARCSAYTCYDSDLDAIWFFGGSSGGAYQDLYRLNLSSWTWSYFAPNGTWPSARSAGACVYDSTNKHIIIISGSGPTSNQYTTIYKYIISSNTWMRIIETNPNTYLERYYVNGHYDPVTKSVYMYGGYNVLNELWKYNVETNTLLLLSPTGSSPGGRQGAATFFREADRSIYLFGGYGTGSVRYNDMYRYSIDENKFYSISTTNTPDLVEFFAASTLDAANDRAYYWGGRFSSGNYNRSIIYSLALTKTYSVAAIPAAVTSDIQSVPVTHWSSLKKAEPTQTVSGNANLYHSISFDKKSTFQVLSLGSEVSLDASAVTDKGSGKVGFPATSHGLSSGNKIRVYGTTSYNGNYTVDADTTLNEIVVVKTYVSETLTSSSKCRVVSWIPIVRDNSNTWQYRDSGGSWQNSAVNDVYSALSQAFGVSANLMTGANLSAISEWEWASSGGFSSGVSVALDFGIGLKPDSTDVPSLTGYHITYATTRSDMTWISPTWSASANDPTKAYCVIDVEPIDSISLDTDLKAWVSIDDGTNYEQISGLSSFQQVGSHVYVRGTKTGLTSRSDNQIKVKVTSHNNKRVKIYKASLEVRY